MCAPQPPAPVNIVDTTLSCDGACGDRATNGKESGDPEYQYCLCSDQCNSNLQIFTASCCGNYKDVCSTVQDGSCIVTESGVSSNLCGTYNDNDLCSCTPDCTDPGNSTYATRIFVRSLREYACSLVHRTNCKARLLWQIKSVAQISRQSACFLHLLHSHHAMAHVAL